VEPFVPSRRRPGLRSRLASRARALTPSIAWLLAVAAVVLLLQHRRRPGPVQGVVEVALAEVRAPAAGRLLALAVVLHAAVQQGQVVARLDDADLRLRLRSARASVEGLRAELGQRRAELDHAAARDAAAAGFDHVVERRRLADSVETAKIDQLSTRAELEEARVRLRGTSIEVERLQQLGTQGMVADTDLVRARTEQDALQQRITELEGVQQSQLQRIDAVLLRQQQFAAAVAIDLPVDTVLEPLRWGLRAQEAEIERLSLLATGLDLQAPTSGVVASLQHQAGEWVAAGETVLTVVEPIPRRIRAYVPASLRELYASAAVVPIGCLSQPGAQFEAKVLTVSPAPVPVPEPLWRVPRQQEWPTRWC
jgi:multidrug resistance efflux pump